MTSLQVSPLDKRKEAAAELLARRQARSSLLAFSLYTMPDYEVNWHHGLICSTLDKFVAKEIKNLMVFMPPQHGKSELVSRRLPAYLLGKFPAAKIAGTSYAHSLAAKFNRDVQRIIMAPDYSKIFPDTTLNASNVRSSAQGSWLRNADQFEVVGHGGGYISVGIGGGLTGNKVDYLIIDDPVKDSVEAKSRSYQLRNWEWFNTVAKSRLHNGSQVIVCMTRWDEDDLAGLLLKLRNKGKGMDWHILQLPAIKEQADDNDPRPLGAALWESKHSLARLMEIKESDPVTFQGLYQQDPAPAVQGRVYPEWQVTSTMSEGQYFYGLDFGFTNDPTVVVKMLKENNRLYIHELIYQTGLTNNQIAQLLISMNVGKAPIYADSAEPKSIQELKNHGLNVKPAVKGKDSILTGINFIKQHQVFVTERSHNILQEQKYYQWHVLADGTPTNEPRDYMNHSMDAIRYAVYTQYAVPSKKHFSI